MIILAEIKCIRVYLATCKTASIYGQNQKAEQLLISERYWILFSKKSLRCNLKDEYYYSKNLH